VRNFFQIDLTKFFRQGFSITLLVIAFFILLASGIFLSAFAAQKGPCSGSQCSSSHMGGSAPGSGNDKSSSGTSCTFTFGGTCQSSCNTTTQTDQGQLNCGFNQTCCTPLPCAAQGGSCQTSCNITTQSDAGQLDCGLGSTCCIALPTPTFTPTPSFTPTPTPIPLPTPTLTFVPTKPQPSCPGGWYFIRHSP